MWTIESSGDLFGGKRLWLRPGRTFLFGRTPSASGAKCDFGISHKGVSRKHLVVAVGKVEPGSSTSVSQRTRLTITDESKFGSQVDGTRFSRDTVVLDKDKHVVRLGSYDQDLTIKWQPVVLTFTASKDTVVKAQQAKLEPFGVKVTQDFLYADTTHVVAGKRNLPKVLQGIIGAKFIVNDDYVDAVVNAATSPGQADDGESPLPSDLEQDFESLWPDPMGFVPPVSNEPVPREPEYLKPDADRTNVFDGFTFVFCDPQQHLQLEPALSLGGAKCPLASVERGKTAASETVKYIRDLAGKKRDGGGLNPDSPKGICVVRLVPKKVDNERVAAWVETFMTDVQQDLDQRAIDQREFLDAILTKDTTGLKRALQYEDESTARAPVSEPPRERRSLVTSEAPQNQQQPSPPPSINQQQDNSNMDVEEAQPGSPTPPPAKKPSKLNRLRSRAATKQKFKGFDDFDDLTPAAPAPQDDAMDEDGPPSNQAGASTQDRGGPAQGDTNGQSQGLFVSEKQPPSTSTRSKKRAIPAHDSDNEPVDPEAAMDDLLPGSRAFKKRRLDNPEPDRSAEPTPARDSDDEDATPQPGSKTAKNAKAKGKKVTQQTDLRQRAREHANAIDKIKEEEPEEDADEVSKLRNLALVEEMDVPGLRRRSASPSKAARSTKSKTTNKGKGKTQQNMQTSDADPWAGRPNFKKFRQKRKPGDEPHSAYNHGTRTIIPVDPVEAKDYGIGERYWASFSMGSSNRSKKKSQSQRTAESQRSRGERERVEDTVPDEQDGEDIPELDALTRQAVEADEREQSRMNEVLPEEMAGPTREGWVREQMRATQESMRGTARETQSGAQDSAPKSSRKRPPERERESPPKRRQTTLGRRGLGRVSEEDDDDDDDELAFKLKRRR